jgi:PilZ domain/GYF domain 2
MEIESKDNWYILHGNQKSGPYDYKKIINMIQKNEIMDYSYVWAPHLPKWSQVYSLKEFSKDRFMLLRSHPEYQDAFVQRKNPRIQTQVEILGHNNIRFFDGTLTSISSEGGLCLINTPLVQVGDKIKIHLKSKSNDESPFNIEGVIIRKNFSQDRLNSKSGLYYVVSFSDLEPAGLDQIKSWIDSTTSKSA